MSKQGANKHFVVFLVVSLQATVKRATFKNTRAHRDVDLAVVYAIRFTHMHWRSDWLTHCRSDWLTHCMSSQLVHIGVLLEKNDGPGKLNETHLNQRLESFDQPEKDTCARSRRDQALRVVHPWHMLPALGLADSCEQGAMAWSIVAEYSSSGDGTHPWHLTFGGPSKKLIFQVPSLRCHVSGREGNGTYPCV